MQDVAADREREIAAEVAQKAMVAGWERAIQDVAASEGLTYLVIENILNKVSADNTKRDPSARIDELNDWQLHKQRNGASDLKRNALHKLSPGLRAYMEKKLSSGQAPK